MVKKHFGINKKQVKTLLVMMVSLILVMMILILMMTLEMPKQMIMDKNYLHLVIKDNKEH
jgi:hypothetical protein